MAKYKTIIFDFDSTLLQYESLEKLLEGQLAEHPQKKQQLLALTEQGMNGELDFYTSLSERLKLAAPTLAAAKSMGEKLVADLTQGAAELVRYCHSNDVAVWIVSGGLREMILPSAAFLNIPEHNVIAVELNWDDAGNFISVNANQAASQSKVDAVASCQLQWQHPVAAVGDGMTDYALYQTGLVDSFIAYTEHVSRAKLLQQQCAYADSMVALKKQII